MSRTCCIKYTKLTCEQRSHNLKIAFVIEIMSTQTKIILDTSRLGHVFYLLHGLQRIPFQKEHNVYSCIRFLPNNYLLLPKRKVLYKPGKLNMAVLHWILSNHLHSYCIHCKRHEVQQCHFFLNCCHVEMTHILL